MDAELLSGGEPHHTLAAGDIAGYCAAIGLEGALPGATAYALRKRPELIDALYAANRLDLCQLILARARPTLISTASADQLAIIVQRIEDIELLHWLKQCADLSAPQVLAAYATVPVWDNPRRQRCLALLVGLSRDKSLALADPLLRLRGTYWTVRGTAELLARARTPSESMALSMYAQGYWRIWGMSKNYDLLRHLHLDDQEAIARAGV